MKNEELRKAMPTVAALVDELRAWMADGGKVIYAEENGHVIDRREPESEVFQIPAGYAPMRQLPQKEKR